MTFIKIVTNYLIYTGVCDVPEESLSLKKILHKIYCIFSLTYLCIYVILQVFSTVEAMINDFDVVNLLELSYLTIVDINIVLKIISIRRQQKGILKICNIFQSNLLSYYKQRDLDLEKKYEYVLR